MTPAAAGGPFPAGSPTTASMPERLVRLTCGLVLFGVSVGFMLSSGLGLSAWDVLHHGLAERTDLSLGVVVIGVSVLVVALWVPLRQRPGIGTVANVVVVGLAVDASLAVLPEPGHLAVRVAFLVTGIVANGVATALYIGAGLGPGPRDGLMTGLARDGRSIRLVRTGIEATVLVLGWALGGAVGVGTVLFAVTIGPLVHHFLPRLAVDGTAAPSSSSRRSPPPSPGRSRPRAGR